MAKQEMSIAEIRNLLAEKNKQVAALRRERKGLVNRVKQIDRQIVQLAGSRRSAPKRRAAKAAPKRATRRARGGPSLKESILRAFAKAGAPMTIADVMGAVTKAGYTSSSGNFRNLVNVTLAQMDEVRRVARGKYALKRSTGAAARSKRTVRTKTTKKAVRKRTRKTKSKAKKAAKTSAA